MPNYENKGFTPITMTTIGYSYYIVYYINTNDVYYNTYEIIYLKWLSIFGPKS